MRLTDTSRLECFGFPDPNTQSSSEYRAMYECMSDALESLDDEDDDQPSELLRSMLIEFREWADNCIEKLDELENRELQCLGGCGRDAAACTSGDCECGACHDIDEDCGAMQTRPFQAEDCI